MTFKVPPTRRQAIADQLRSEILAGALAAGVVLKDAELAARLGVSITPVREAIAQLAAEGLVEIAPNRARTVAGLSQKTALELVDVLEIIACAGFARGVGNLSKRQILLLRERHRAYEVAIENGDMAASSALGAELSRIVIEASGNGELQALFDGVANRTAQLVLVKPGSPVVAPWVRGFAEVVDLLERGKRTKATARYQAIFPEFRSIVGEALRNPEQEPLT